MALPGSYLLSSSSCLRCAYFLQIPLTFNSLDDTAFPINPKLLSKLLTTHVSITKMPSLLRYCFDLYPPILCPAVCLPLPHFWGDLWPLPSWGQQGEISSPWDLPSAISQLLTFLFCFQSPTCANSYAVPDLYSWGKKKPRSCESASLVVQNAFWKCLCAGMPTRKFERDPASWSAVK